MFIVWSHDSGEVGLTILLNVVPNGDLEEVPSNDDLQDEVNGAGEDGVEEGVGSKCDDKVDGEQSGQNDADEVEDFGEPDNLTGSLLVTLLEPLIPDPGVVESDEREEDTNETEDDVNGQDQDAVNGVHDTAKNG